MPRGGIVCQCGEFNGQYAVFGRVNVSVYVAHELPPAGIALAGVRNVGTGR